MSDESERVITAKHAGSCRLCHDHFGEGARIVWSPVLGVRCFVPPDIDDEDACIGRYGAFLPEDNPSD